jgi:ureidoglycolate amidohydrolase
MSSVLRRGYLGILVLLQAFATCGLSDRVRKGIRVDEQRLVDQIRHLARFSDDPNPAVTRILFTENDVLARKYIISLMEDIGLDVHSDAMGSIVGTWMPDSEGSHPAQASVMTGSHCDAIPLAGSYDGTVGVLGGIEAVRALKSAGFVPNRPIQVIMFTSEEPTRFGLSCISSRAMAGALSPKELSHLQDSSGIGFMQAARDAGYQADEIQSEYDIIRNVSSYSISSFVELHIEQGPELEALDVDIGVVTAIAAPSAFFVSFQGEGGHAGALLMKNRHDASLAAAELALEVEKAVVSTGSHDIVGTVGKWKISPGAINSVPRSAELEIDIRDPDPDRRSKVIHQVKEAAERIASRRGVVYEIKTLSLDPPGISSNRIVEIVESAASHYNLSSRRMISRAYHDSLFMAQISEMGMIFIPSKGGKSHRPDEFTAPHLIRQGVTVLAYTLGELAGESSATVSRTEL